ASHAGARRRSQGHSAASLRAVHRRLRDTRVACRESVAGRTSGVTHAHSDRVRYLSAIENSAGLFEKSNHRLWQPAKPLWQGTRGVSTPVPPPPPPNPLPRGEGESLAPPPYPNRPS